MQLKRQKFSGGRFAAFLEGSARRRWFYFCLLPCVCFAQAPGPPNAVFISSPKPQLISGEQAQLSVTARDGSGRARQGDNFSWVSSNSGILGVDSRGMVTARRLGIADVTAAVGNVRGTVRLQVLPQRLDVTPGISQVFVGARLQFFATAYDVNGDPVPDTAFAWQVTGANGGGTQAATISPSGLFTARATGTITVRALVNYPGVLSQFVNQYPALATVVIKPRNFFKLNRLLSSGDSKQSFQLRPVFAPMAVNDQGQIAFLGSLDGLATALLLYDNGRFDVLASGGTPGPIPGGLVVNFSPPAINNRGQVLTRVGVQGPGSGLLLASRTGSSFVVLDGEPAGGVENLTGLIITRDSLNDNGDIVFRANFRLPGSTVNHVGLFRLSNGSVQRVWSDIDALPGLAAPVGFDQAFGIDRDGAIYFSAFSGTARAIFRQERFAAPTRIIGTADSFADANIASLSGLTVSPSGEMALAVGLSNGAQYIVRIAGGQVQNLPVRGLGPVYSAAGGAALFYADAGRGWGLQRWSNNGVDVILLPGRLAPNDEPIRNFYSAVLTSRGDVFAQLQTADNPMVVAQPGGPRPLLFQTGARINATANLHIYSGSLVRGSGYGPPRLLVGSPGSIFEFDGRGLAPRLVLGDRLPDGAVFSGIFNAMETSADEVYFNFSGIRRLTADRLERILRGSFRTDDGVNVGGGGLAAVNGNGLMVWSAGTNQNHSRLYLRDGGRDILLATTAQNPRWLTPGPAGGTITGWGEVAIDDLGRVMAVLRVSDGPGGLFLYEKGRWQPTALIGVFPIGNQKLTDAADLRAVDGKFYASLRVPGASPVAEFRDANWNLVAAPGDVAPNGSIVNNVGTYDVNRRGDLAFVAFLQGGGTAVLRRSGDDTQIVHISNESIDGTDYVRNYSNIELREDGRIYFTALDVFDRFLLFVAEPPLTTWPARSRQR